MWLSLAPFVLPLGLLLPLLEPPPPKPLLPQLPRLLHERLNQDLATQAGPVLRELLIQQKKRNALLMVIALLLGAGLLFFVYTYFI